MLEICALPSWRSALFDCWRTVRKAGHRQIVWKRAYCRGRWLIFRKLHKFDWHFAFARRDVVFCRRKDAYNMEDTKWSGGSTSGQEEKNEKTAPVDCYCSTWGEPRAAWIWHFVRRMGIQQRNLYFFPRPHYPTHWRREIVIFIEHYDGGFCGYFNRRTWGHNHIEPWGWMCQAVGS